MVLEAAYELLEEKGIGAVGIKPIAAKLGCSTQPVSWIFGSMTELKKELFFYAGHKLYDSMQEVLQIEDPIEAFYASGVQYISGAMEHPNVFRFVNVDDPELTIGERVYGENTIFDLQFNKYAAEVLTEKYDISPEKIGETVRDVVIYTHGLVMMMMFDSFKLPKEEACRMMLSVGEKLLQEIGIDISGYAERLNDKYYKMIR